MLRFAVLLALVLVSGVASRARPRERRHVPIAGATRAPFPPECDQTRFPEECEQSPLDISFLVDASSSIGKVNFVRCLNFLEDFVSNFVISPSKVRVSMVTFALQADENNAFGFNNYTDLESLKIAISNTHYTGYPKTTTSAGLWYILNNQASEARNDTRYLVIVITDGRSQETSLTKQAAEELLALKDKRGGEMEVFAIGVGGSVYYPELATIAGVGRNVFEVASYELLQTLTERLIFMSCAVPTTPACEMDPVELAFVIDASSSIGNDNFTAGIDFVKSFASEFQIGPDHVRLAAVTFDRKENPDQAIHFDDYVDEQGLLRRLEAINYTAYTYTNTGAGIKYMAENLMARARPNTGRICVVMTDGNSQEWQKTADEADAAQAAGITMYAIGVGGTVSQDELTRIAGVQNRTFTVDDYSQLNTFKQGLLKATCDSALENIAAHGSKQKSKYNRPQPSTIAAPL